MRLRGEYCVGLSTLLSLATLILLIFTHVGQINTSSVPQGIAMAKVNVSLLGVSLESALLDPIEGLYTANVSEPLMQHHGLRQYYQFGLYGHCGYTDTDLGICSNQSAAYEYQPYAVMTGDMRANYTTITNALLDSTTFSNNDYLGNPTKGAYYTILLAALCSFLALVTGVTKKSIWFVVSATFATIATILVLSGATIWTVMINKSRDINDFAIGDVSTSGIEVSIGIGTKLLWSAFGTSFASLIPYYISCCTYRG